MSGVSILLVDDHPVVREGYRRLLEMRPQFSVCAEAEDVAQAYLAYKSHKPDVVVMDLTLQGASGLEAVRRQSQCFSDCGEANIAIDAGEDAAGGTVVRVRDNLKIIV